MELACAGAQKLLFYPKSLLSGQEGMPWARAFTPTQISHFFPTENPYGDTQGYHIRDRVGQGTQYVLHCVRVIGTHRKIMV